MFEIIHRISRYSFGNLTLTNKSIDKKLEFTLLTTNLTLLNVIHNLIDNTLKILIIASLLYFKQGLDRVHMLVVDDKIIELIVQLLLELRGEPARINVATTIVQAQS